MHLRDHRLLINESLQIFVFELSLLDEISVILLYFLDLVLPLLAASLLGPLLLVFVHIFEELNTPLLLIEVDLLDDLVWQECQVHQNENQV